MTASIPYISASPSFYWPDILYRCYQKYIVQDQNFKRLFFQGVNCYYVSKKMKLLVTGSEDGVIRIWNLVIVFNPLFTLTSHRYGIIDLVVIDSKKILLSLSRDGVSLIKIKWFKAEILIYL